MARRATTAKALKPSAKASASPEPPASPPKRKRSDRETVRRKILDAARDLFSTRGYPGATTREIAERAGVNEVWLYRYFGSKAALFRHAVFDQLSMFFRDYAENVPSSGHVARTTFYSERLLERLRTDKALIMSLVTAHHYQDGVTPGLGQMPEMREYFDMCIQGHATNRDYNMDIQLGVRLTFGLILSLALFEDWLLETPGEFSPAEVSAAVAKFVSQGLIGQLPESLKTS